MMAQKRKFECHHLRLRHHLKLLLKRRLLHHCRLKDRLRRP